HLHQSRHAHEPEERRHASDTDNRLLVRCFELEAYEVGYEMLEGRVRTMKIVGGFEIGFAVILPCHPLSECAGEIAGAPVVSGLFGRDLEARQVQTKAAFVERVVDSKPDPLRCR